MVCCTIPTLRQIMLCIKNNKQHNKLFPEIKLHNKNKTDLCSNMTMDESRSRILWACNHQAQLKLLYYWKRFVQTSLRKHFNDL